ncbi:UDP-N-acetylhexosamine pyrophosphorylase-like isoform X2 [Gordionus sp. m RMFG-2023]|uniref:UDP-N-acetylhexosamine pyrophosphorylase-like isoform X2 n=1 Tax=Gordionus sp. m RMFG-2023 TaxID=3053472 RepID=UPI0031FD1E48
MKDIEINNLQQHLEKFNQSQVLRYWNSLTHIEKNELYEDLNQIKYENIEKIFNDAINDLEVSKKLLDPYIEPVFEEDLGIFKYTSKALLKEYEALGLQMIRQRKVAVILMAGGVGTRLGVNYPKGMYDVGLLSNKSLYQLQAERILKLNQLCHMINIDENPLYTFPGYINWCIMASDNTIDQTKAYFESHRYFGLDPKSIIFFKQHSIPCLDMTGKIIMESPSKISLSPEGNGGIYKALLTSEVLNTLLEKGVEYIHVYGVDNILVKVADPIFIGFCVKKQADCGVKVIEKVEPSEAVGVVCRVQGKYQVVEYSEISMNTSHKTNPEGHLLFNCGNIVNHLFTIDFLRKACQEHETLKYHVAKKKIPYANEEGVTIKPDQPNGIKMEKFIFDVFPISKKFVVWSVERDQEFSPLKNSDVGSSDSNPSTCRKDLYALHKKYVIEAGGTFVDENGTKKYDGACEKNGDANYNPKSKAEFACEISPIVSYAGEDLEDYVKGKTFRYPFLLNYELERNNPSILNIVKGEPGDNENNNHSNITNNDNSQDNF